MLLYHFGSKDALVATVLRAQRPLGRELVRALPPSRTCDGAVLDLWAGEHVRAAGPLLCACTSRPPRSGCSARSRT